MQVEVWSDLVCPWCYIGKHRFAQALAEFPDRDQVHLVHRAFQLHPNALNTGQRVVEMIAEHYDIDPDQALDMLSDEADTAAGEGLRVQMGEILVGNTAAAHRTVLWAQQHDPAAAARLLEGLFAGYFEAAAAIFIPADLVPFVQAAGLNPDAALLMLEGDEFSNQVHTDQAEATRLGARGVPFVVIGDQPGIFGAEPVAVYLAALTAARR